MFDLSEDASDAMALAIMRGFRSSSAGDAGVPGFPTGTALDNDTRNSCPQRDKR